MHATIRSYTDQALADALVARADDVRSVISEVPGFRAYYLVRTESGTVSVTVCDDEAGAAASTQVAAAFLRDNLPDVGGSAPTVASGEVVLSA